MRVLIVEDSSRLRAQIGQALKNSSYVVDSTGDGAEGLWMIRENRYDAVILDIMLPSMDGLTVLRHLREEGDLTHVLLLTAKDTVADRVFGLENGADDYLIKPFDLEELLARVMALCRRSHGQKSQRIVIGNLVLDVARKEVRLADEVIKLTSREYRLLELLALRRGDVVSQAEIENSLYDEQTDLMSNAVQSAICDLRRKLASPDGEDLILTRRGFGYLIPSAE